MISSLLVDSSRAVADLVVAHVGTDREKILKLYNLALLQKGQLSMRAARALDLCDEAHPGACAFLIREMYDTLRTLSHLSVLRCFLRLLQRYPLPTGERKLMQFFDQSIEWVTRSEYPIALRYYGLRNMDRVCDREPGLRLEIIPILEDLLDDPSPGLRGQVRKILEKFRKSYGR